MALPCRHASPIDRQVLCYLQSVWPFSSWDPWFRDHNRCPNHVLWSQAYHCDEGMPNMRQVFLTVREQRYWIKEKLQQFQIKIHEIVSSAHQRKMNNRFFFYSADHKFVFHYSWVHLYHSKRFIRCRFMLLKLTQPISSFLWIGTNLEKKEWKATQNYEVWSSNQKTQQSIILLSVLIDAYAVIILLQENISCKFNGSSRVGGWGVITSRLPCPALPLPVLFLSCLRLPILPGSNHHLPHLPTVG